MNPKRKRSKSQEIFTATVNTEGVTVRVSCIRIDTPKRSRLELQLEAAAQHALVDLPISQLPDVQAVANEAAQAFAASLRLRMRPDGRLL
jgi:hypothetical protein